MDKRKTCNKRVICIETGEIFDTVREAAESVGRKTPTLSKHLHGGT